MATTIATGSVHHLTLTVTNVQRSGAFYTSFLGFQLVMELGPRHLLSNGSVILALTPPPDPAQALQGDRFSENRVGLDHVSLNVARRADLETAIRLFDEQGVGHGEITDLGADLGLYVLAFRDPDNIQLELTAPYA
jgi:catechol 2,3-dioxygenase-like lactoylglutathione lyase family enzyme